MWLVKYALRRPYSMGALAILVFILGLSSLRQLPVDILPEVKTPVVNVVWTYQGLNAREMATKITSFSELALLNNVDNVKEISSETFNGVGLVRVVFQNNVEIDVALSQVGAISQTILRRMPAGTSPPIVVRNSLSSRPILSMVVSSDTLSQSQLADYARIQLRGQVQSIGGMRLTLPYGGATRQIMIDLKPDALPAFGLSAADVAQAVNQQNLTLPSGNVREGMRDMQISVDASPESAEVFANLPISARDGRIIKLRDVADVRDGGAIQTNLTRVDGSSAVLVSMIKIGDASTTEIIEKVKERLPEIQAAAPAGAKITPIFDQSIFVQSAVDIIAKEILIVGFLVGLVVFIFLGSIKSSLIVLVSIPLSLLVAVIAVKLTGHTLNLMSLAGLALAVGILVDNAMVEIENINRNIGLGLSAPQAALAGAKQVAFPEFVSTLSTCIVFTPIFLLEGIAGYVFQPLAITVIAALAASYFFSRTVVPTLAALNLGKNDKHYKGFHKLEASIDRLGDGIANRLPALRAKWPVVALVVVLIVASAGTLLAISPQQYFPRTDAGLLKLYVRGPAGTRVEETANKFAQVQTTIRELIPEDEVKQIVELIGQPDPVNMSWVDTMTIGSFDGEMLIELNPKKASTFEYQTLLRKELTERYPDFKFLFLPADITNQTLSGLTPTSAEIRVIGRDVPGNMGIAQELLKKLDGSSDISDLMLRQVGNLPEYVVSIDRDRALALGITSADALQTLLGVLGTGGTVAPSYWSDPRAGISYVVQVQAPLQTINSAEDLLRLPITTPGGESIQLGAIATITPRTVPATVVRSTLQPVVSVLANAPGANLRVLAEQSQEAVAELQSRLKPGNKIEINGQATAMTEAFRELAIGLLGALALIVLVMVFNFQSWVLPFVALSSLPVALSGAVAALYVTGTPISVPALMGLIMTMGITTANSVLLTSFARDAWVQGMGAWDAALQTVRQRIRPILMTALTMIVGLIPMATALGQGAEQNAPLARAVIGGLMTGSVATLILVPLIFTFAMKNAVPGKPLVEE
ncbi:MAG: efflux RND transporter permease subunit [Limnobacter sp.]|jgi:multidrug efflux pump subunit AcrB|uniref:efflux RND transporter permease subunit n=1 Tax=unclassified Limnobacter TaxID=2630203 RepID=UPI000C4F25E5|nr:MULTISPECIES: efflux RND transporter permease subunit [unclassified Limnobacter]MAG80517.1 multidrug transporter [Sutterellaceae bacterium]MBT83030.1 multidrug transporter [Sutterellaceae bacterium]MDZ4050996.1 efflux RND transporter permease subunit [Limnobacter sp.]RZO94627.1 MAG: efflux RND transporter permease subunit [Limnobacter sp.]HAV74299.1 AcrB/AcrD/AcrF family protein [Limnobacter sp.]